MQHVSTVMVISPKKEYIVFTKYEAPRRRGWAANMSRSGSKDKPIYKQTNLMVPTSHIRPEGSYFFRISLLLARAALALAAGFALLWSLASTVSLTGRLLWSDGARLHASTIVDDNPTGDAEIGSDLHRKPLTLYACQRLPVGHAHDLCVRQQENSLPVAHSATAMQPGTAR